MTGASSGIGRALAVELARAGWAVGLVARRADRLEELRERIRSLGGRASVHPADVTDREAVHGAAAGCAEVLGPIDLLVANAGISEMTVVDELDAELVERMIRVNYLGAVYAVEAVLPAMLGRDRGHLVAVGSLAGIGGLPKSAGYSASKAAQAVFFESLRLDLRGTGVDVTVIKPGYVRTAITDRNRHRMPGIVEPEEAARRMLDAIERRVPEYRFPAGLGTLAWLAQILPRRLYDRLASGRDRDKTPGADAGG